MNEIDDLTDAAVTNPPLAPPSMEQVALRVSQRRRRRIGMRLCAIAAIGVVVTGGVVLTLRDDNRPADLQTSADDSAEPAPPSPIPEPSQNPVVIEPDPVVGAPCGGEQQGEVEPDIAVGATGAFEGWLNTEPRAAAEAYVQDWDVIGDAVLEAADVAPLPLEGYEGEVHDLFFGVDDVVCVVYTINNAGTTVFGATGTAVLADGEWKVSSETVCDALRAGTVRCPGDEAVAIAQPAWCQGQGAETLSLSALVFEAPQVRAGCNVAIQFSTTLVDAEVMGDDVIMWLVEDPTVVVQHSGVFTDRPFAALAAVGTMDDGWPVTGEGTLKIPAGAQPGRYHVEFLDHPAINGELEVVAGFGGGIAINADNLFANTRLFLAGEFVSGSRREVSLGSTSPEAQRWAYSFEVSAVPWFGTEAAPYDPDAAEIVEIVVDADLADLLDREVESGRQWILAVGGVDTAEGLMAATVFGPAGVFRLGEEGDLNALDSRIEALTADEFEARIAEL